MTIYRIPTLEKAAEIMEQAYLTSWEFIPIVFDLIESIDANDVQTRISRCPTCNRVIYQNLGAYLNECPRCREDHLQVLVDVMLVIQGSIVIYTAWRE